MVSDPHWDHPRLPNAMFGCMGSFALGTACGACARCAEEALRLVPALMWQKKMLERRLLRVATLVPPPMPPELNADYSDEIKLRFFDELRRLVHEEERTVSPVAPCAPPTLER